MNTAALVQDLAIQFAASFFLTLSIGFLAIHAAQRVEDPVQRAGWLMLIVVLNVLGATLYLLTKYQKFRSIGKGNLIVAKQWTWSLKEYFCLSEAEKGS